MLELAILGLLKEHELHGYELKKRLAEELGFASRVSFGSLYPALGRLEAAGAVEAVLPVEPDGHLIPHTGSLSGELAAFRSRKASTRGTRGKKVYAITARGEELFEELLAAETQSNEDERTFNLRLAFARYLPPDARIGMLERRRAHLVERLIQIRARVKAARDAYAQSLVEHDREAAEHDLSWIDRLLASERAGYVPERNAGYVPERNAGYVPERSPGYVPERSPGYVPERNAHPSESVGPPLRSARASKRKQIRSGRGLEQPAHRSAGDHSPTISGLRPASYQEDNQQ
jgi:DNA-binding PadR family transcriptional regulator